MYSKQSLKDSVLVCVGLLFFLAGPVSAQVNAELEGDLKVTDDFTVDTNTLHVDSTHNRVGIGTSAPQARVHISTNGR